jgi:nucleoid DNA-binding protein|tara:strand:+ start:509 stop:790 length:282 start_codon:yes stop_codon:yes gene_type:complete
LSKKKLIKQLKEKNPHLNQSEIETVINTFSQNITVTLKKGNSVEIRGFGRFYTKKLKENFNARNPATNKLIYKPERVKVRFRPAKKLKQIVNK